LDDTYKNRSISPTVQKIAFTKGKNVYLIDEKGIVTQVSQETNPEITCGTAVHRNEFGIDKGIFWSPKGNYLAFYRMDETMVGNYPIVDISTREAEVKPVKYPMAGMASHHVTIGIYDLQNNRLSYLQTGEPLDRYFTNLSWTTDEELLFVAELNRDQTDCCLKSYDIQTGKVVKELINEHSDTYVEPEYPALFLKQTPRFIWQSVRDGYNHLYLYHRDGTLDKQLTSGQWTVIDILGMDEKEKNIYIVSTENSPVDKTIWKVDIKSGKRTLLSTPEGVHNAILSESGNYITDTYTAIHTPRITEVIQTNTLQKIKLLTSSDPLTEFNTPDITLGTLKSADGKYDLYYRMVKPVNFDPKKKYPTVVYVYGGPKSQMVNNSWLANYRGWELYMAQKGYVIFCMDGRGTSYRGIQFEQATHKHLGVCEAEDQAVGARYLQSLPFVDGDRLGVHGWSYGGFMTINLLLRYPDLFKVGVAGGPVCDWKYYEVMYGERYMSTPEKNPDGYKNSSLIENAGKLKGRLLIIHDDMDDTVVLQHSIGFLKACVKANTYPDYFIYPGHPHNVSGPDQIHLHEKITRYFEDFLKQQ
jgi:dipeptidyl-peptidase 4